MPNHIEIFDQNNIYNNKTYLLSQIIKSYKEICIKTIHKKYNDYNFMWQKSYYDVIIRNKTKFEIIRKYIIENPLKWNIANNTFFANHSNIYLYGRTLFAPTLLPITRFLQIIPIFICTDAPWCVPTIYIPSTFPLLKGLYSKFSRYLFFHQNNTPINNHKYLLQNLYTKVYYYLPS